METTTTFEAIDRNANGLRISGRHQHVDSDTLYAEMAVLADSSIVKAMHADEDGRWIADPECENVWGWQAGDMSGRKVAVVYYRALADFELDGEWELDMYRGRK